MRVSFILSSLWLSGGVRCIVEIANRLNQHGHEISIVIPKGTRDPDMAAEIQPGVRVIESGISREQKKDPLTLIELSWSLARAVPTSDFVISTHTPTTPAGWIATRILRKGTPVWYYQDYLEMFLDRPVEKWLLRHALRWNRGALVVSEYSRDELNQFVPGKEVIVIQNGISHKDSFYPEASAGRISRQMEKTILYLGDMRPRKGWEDFFSAMALVYEQDPMIKLWIVSKEECQVNTRIPFQLIYRPSRAELADFYRRCDVFVSTSWWESFGLPPLEAMACGSPVVLTDSRGCREYARPGENCLMVPIREPKALAEAVLRIIHDDELSKEFRENGPITAKEFDWVVVTNRFEDGLKKILQR